MLRLLRVFKVDKAVKVFRVLLVPERRVLPDQMPVRVFKAYKEFKVDLVFKDLPAKLLFRVLKVDKVDKGLPDLVTRATRVSLV